MTRGEKHAVVLVASATVHGIPSMTASARRDLCNWLRKLARDIQREPEAYAEKFRARFYLVPGKAALNGE